MKREEHIKHEEHMKYFYIGITAFCVMAAGITFFFCLSELSSIQRMISKVAHILSPIIYGLVFAYLLNPVYNFFQKHSENWLRKNFKKLKKAHSLSKGISTIAALAVFLLILFGVIAMVIPQVIQSIMGIVETLPKNIQDLAKQIEKLLEDNPELEEQFMKYYTEGWEWIQGWLKNDLVPNMQVLVTNVSSGVISALNFVKNLLIGLIVTIYVINSKTEHLAQSKKIIYSLFPEKTALFIIDQFRLADKMFGGFIIGKIIDSIIIGCLCFVGMSILRFPYTMLISVIIGVTNVIPFFGPFIGAAPSALLILLVNPLQSIYFLIFILILQQFDGNILGPKILGNSTGLSSFWVLFSILFFGGIWGFVGMIIGVPLFAVIYELVSTYINHRLRAKDMSTVTDHYLDK